MSYAPDDISVKKGHIMTRDGKYYLAMDGDYDYWHRVRSREGDHLKIGHPLGRYSYDYCFRSNLPGAVDTLNAILEKQK